MIYEKDVHGVLIGVHMHALCVCLAAGDVVFRCLVGILRACVVGVSTDVVYSMMHMCVVGKNTHLAGHMHT